MDVPLFDSFGFGFVWKDDWYIGYFSNNTPFLGSQSRKIPTYTSIKKKKLF